MRAQIVNTVAAAVGLAAVLGAAPAKADDGNDMRAICQSNACIVDANNKIVGVPLGSELMYREIAGDWNQLNVLDTGIGDNFLLYYDSTNCTGQPYMSNIGQLPKPVEYDGQKFWGPKDAPASFNWKAYQYLSNGVLTCVPYGQYCGASGTQECGGIGSTAAPIGQPVTFKPNFRIRLLRGN